MTFQSDHPFPLAHMVYFQLADRSPGTMQKFIDYCKEYLSGHPGQSHFSVGARAVEMQRDVNARDFDVAMNIIFDGLPSYDSYSKSSRHEKFITVTAGMSTARKVFDSYLQ